MLGENSQSKPDFAGLGGTSEWLGLGPLLGSVDFRAAMHHPLVLYRTVQYCTRRIRMWFTTVTAPWRVKLLSNPLPSTMVQSPLRRRKYLGLSSSVKPLLRYPQLRR